MTDSKGNHVWKLGVALNSQNKYALVLITLEPIGTPKLHLCSQCSERHSTHQSDRPLIYPLGYHTVKIVKTVSIQWLTRETKTQDHRTDLPVTGQVFYSNAVMPESYIVDTTSKEVAPRTAITLDDQLSYSINQFSDGSSSSVCRNDFYNTHVLCHAKQENCFVVENSIAAVVDKYQRMYKRAQELKQTRVVLVDKWIKYRDSETKLDPKMDNHVLSNNEKTVVWKAGKDDFGEEVVIEMMIYNDTARVTQTCTAHEHCRLMRKSRVAEAYVVRIWAIKDQTERKKAFGWYQTDFVYAVGTVVKPDSFDPDPEECCGHGIHVHKHRVDCRVHSKLLDPLGDLDAEIYTLMFLFPK